jgi:23S rRNA pseudouridine2605 synthase
MSELMRVQKFLSRAGVCSRRKAEEYMLDGRVKINGEVCRELGTKVDPDRDTVEVDGQMVTRDDNFIYILLNKPSQYITTLDDPKDRPTVADLLPAKMPRIWPVGRLDWDTEGLLIMTNDGKLTNLVTHPSHELSKTYAVKVRGLLSNDSDDLARLRQGVRLDDGYVTRPAQAVVTGDNGRNSWLEVVIREGKNRQIRRMFEAIGYPVMKLRRIAIGTIHIKGLSSGEYRSLTHDEVVDLYGLVEAELPERAIPSAKALKRERQAIDRGKLPDHEARKKKFFGK